MLILIFWPLKWWCRLEVQGIETIPESGAVLVVSNHDSWMDPLALGAAIMTRDRPLRFLAKAQENNVIIGAGMTDPKGDRSKRPHEQVDPDLFLHVTGRNEKGIFVTGAAATANDIRGNLIGTKADGVSALGNGADLEGTGPGHGLAAPC